MRLSFLIARQFLVNHGHKLRDGRRQRALHIVIRPMVTMYADLICRYTLRLAHTSRRLRSLGIYMRSSCASDASDSVQSGTSGTDPSHSTIQLSGASQPGCFGDEVPGGSEGTGGAPGGKGGKGGTGGRSNPRGKGGFGEILRPCQFSVVADD